MKQSAKFDESQVSGFLTKEETLILRNISFRMSSPYRKKTYTQWICDGGHSFFFKIIRCPACESVKVEEKVTRIRLDSREEEIQAQSPEVQKKIIATRH